MRVLNEFTVDVPMKHSERARIGLGFKLLDVLNKDLASPGSWCVPVSVRFTPDQDDVFVWENIASGPGVLLSGESCDWIRLKIRVTVLEYLLERYPHTGKTDDSVDHV